MGKPRSLALVSHSLSGHRAAYIEQFASLVAPGVQAPTLTHWSRTLAEPGPVLFLMIEESFFGYASAALLRALLGRRTAGLLFRGREAAKGASLRLTVKRRVLRLMRRVPGITTLSIVPFALDPALCEVADDWIDDPQMWDLDSPSTPTTPLGEDVRRRAGVRRVLVALGLQNRAKGFEFLARLLAQDAQIARDWMVVAAGKTFGDPAAAEAFQKAGGWLIDRFISDDELMSLYGVADLVWSCYAPDYDQASGIFSRAVQLGVPVVVRAGSGIAAQAQLLEHPFVALPWDEAAATGLLAGAPDGGPPSPHVAGMRRRSLHVLNTSLDNTLGDATYHAA